MRYKGSVSAFWWAVTAAVVALCACYIANAVLSGADSLTAVLCAVPVAVAGVLAWTLLDNYVDLEESSLRVCVGPFRLRVLYEDVVRVSEYRLEGAVIALAMGRDRVTIERRGRVSVVVSVEDANGFRRELQRRSGCR